MSNEQYAFLTRSELPTLEQLQAKINSDPTFTLAIDPEVSLSTTAGFVPCVICGVESGVEIYFDDSPETMDQFADLVQGKDCCLVFCWRSDMVECACAMVLSYFLGEHYNAIISYDGEPPDSIEGLRDETIAVHGDAKLDLQ